MGFFGRLFGSSTSNVESLIKQLRRGRNWGARREAALALARLADPRAVEPLIAAMGDEVGEVRRAAAKALGQIRDPRGIEALIFVLSSARADIGLREAAAEVLGETGDQRVVDPLIAALKDPANEVRNRAVWGLGRLRDPRALEPLNAVYGEVYAGYINEAIAQIKGFGGLLEAVQQGDVNVVRRLLDNGGDVNSSHDHSGDEYSLLAVAIDKGDLKVAGLLLERGADPNKGLKNQRYSPLMWAAQRGDARAVKMLLAKGADVAFVSTYHDNTVLQIAAFKGDVEVVRALLAGGADVNQRTGKDNTALGSAIAGKQPEVIKLLREAGAH